MGILSRIKRGVQKAANTVGKPVGNWLNNTLNTGSKAIGSIYGNITGRTEAMDLAKQQFEYTKEQDERNYDYLRNELQYKSEDAAKAGIHQSAIYGGGMSGAMAPSPGGSGSQDRGSVADLLGLAQIPLIQAQAREANANAGSIKADTQGKLADLENDLSGKTADQLVAMMEESKANRDLLKEKANESRANINWLEEQIGTSQEMTRQAKDYFKIEYARMEYNLQKLKESKLHESQLSTKAGLAITVLNDLMNGNKPPEGVIDDLMDNKSDNRSSISDAIINRINRLNELMEKAIESGKMPQLNF